MFYSIFQLYFNILNSKKTIGTQFPIGTFWYQLETGYNSSILIANGENEPRFQKVPKVSKWYQLVPRVPICFFEFKMAK